MDVLFLHPNFPGQFRRLAQTLAQEPKHRVWALGDAAFAKNSGAHWPNITLWRYPAVATPATAEVHPWAAGFDRAVRTAEAVLCVLAEHKQKGFEPDVIFVHPGWGGAFFLRDFFPGAKVIGLFEYYYRARGADVGFDPEFPSGLNDIFRLHTSNATQLLALESCDIGICATQWQRSRFPQAYQPVLEVLHEGIDTELVAPDPLANFQVLGGPLLHYGDEVVTYVSRHLEPYRGFHVWMRALPELLQRRPQAQVVIVGEPNGTSYGKPPPQGGSWKDLLLQEVGAQIDWQRVHFVGKLPYEQYLRVLQVSAVHVYLTYPFVLSWSLLEAMSAGCLVVASDTAPVREVITHAETGLLVGFHPPQEWAQMVAQALAHRNEYARMRSAGRQLVQARFDFSRVTLPAYQKLMAH